MNRIIPVLFIIMAMFMLTNCKHEVEGVCDIRSVSIEFTETAITFTPIIGDKDNYSYTVTYFIDGTEIGKIRKVPYTITHELSEHQRTPGIHKGEIKFNGKVSDSGVELYIERNFMFSYLVSETGELDFISQ